MHMHLHLTGRFISRALHTATRAHPQAKLTKIGLFFWLVLIHDSNNSSGEKKKIVTHHKNIDLEINCLHYWCSIIIV